MERLLMTSVALGQVNSGSCGVNPRNWWSGFDIPFLSSRQPLEANVKSAPLGDLGPIPDNVSVHATSY
jgi:hypothetical protein